MFITVAIFRDFYAHHTNSDIKLLYKQRLTSNIR